MVKSTMQQNMGLKMRNVDNLVPHMEKLNDKHRAFLLRVIRIHGELIADIHLGTLPFLKKDIAVECLTKSLTLVTPDSNAEADRKYARNILNHLGVTTESNLTTFKFFLNDTKVQGMSSQQGSRFTVRLPFFIEKEAGMKWQEFGKKYVPNKMQKLQVISLSRIKMGVWAIECPAVHTNKVKEFLLERYGN